MSNAGRGDAGSCTTGYLPKGTQGRFRNCPSRTHRHLCRCPEAQTHLPPDQRHDLGPARNHGYLHKRWAIELLFKQIKQNFPLKYFYGECQCHQDTDLGNVDRQPAAHDNAEEAHTLLELFGLGHNGQDNTDVLCGFLQPL